MGEKLGRSVDMGRWGQAPDVVRHVGAYLEEHPDMTGEQFVACLLAGIVANDDGKLGGLFVGAFKGDGRLTVEMVGLPAHNVAALAAHAVSIRRDLGLPGDPAGNGV